MMPLHLKIKNAIRSEKPFFDVNFSRFLDEDGYDGKLDVYETTSAKKFIYSPLFRKFSTFSDSYEGVYVREGLLYSPNGTIHVAKLNTSTDIYESRMGIVLVEEGRYSISFNAIFFDPGIPYFSENTPETYYFTVEE